MIHFGQLLVRSRRRVVIAPARRSMLAALLLVAASTAIAQDQSEIQPEAEFQTAIQQVADVADRDRQQAALQRLTNLSAVAPEMLVRQLAWYAGRSAEARRNAVVGVILRRTDLAAETIARALWPMLEAGDADIAGAVRGLLIGIEHRSATRRPDLSVYRGIIEERVRSGEGPPAALIRYMYEVDAGAAMLVVMRAHQLREPEAIKRVLWAEHLVSNALWKQQNGFLRIEEVDAAAVEQVRMLALHESWWARLCASEIMRRYTAFRVPELIQSLARDSDPLVRASAEAISSNVAAPARP